MKVKSALLLVLSIMISFFLLTIIMVSIFGNFEIGDFDDFILGFTFARMYGLAAVSALFLIASIFFDYKEENVIEDEDPRERYHRIREMGKI